MSSARSWALGVVAASLIPSAAAGQTGAGIEAKVRTLESLHAAAVRARDHADRLRRATFDTLREGPVMVLVHRQSVTATRAALAITAPLIQATYGDAAAALGVATAETPPMTLGDSTLTEFGARQGIVHQVERRLQPPTGHPWYAWTGNALIAPFSREELADGLTRTFITLVTSGSPATAGCVAGRIRQCRVALELVPVADRVTQWYSPEQRQKLARDALGESSSGQSSSPLVRRCARGADDACIQALRTGELATWPPLGSSDRVALARWLLANGGSGGYTRLTTPARDMPQVIERIAGLPVDSVVAGWRAAVLAARPGRGTTSARTGWAAVFWLVVFGAIALGSTRWRRI